MLASEWAISHVYSFSTALNCSSSSCCIECYSHAHPTSDRDKSRQDSQRTAGGVANQQTHAAGARLDAWFVQQQSLLTVAAHLFRRNSQL